ncbi:MULTISPECIES: HAD-IIB family hydrolase [Modicisalibacter]|uniref:HAD-IIB family hydrolase n=1 Tax=Modicisalibacter TaxID=574347 RepID=UPI00100A786C|nr:MULTISPECIES: HAD-IIB family hydrolase [Halomonadaceae]MBZ9557499.1 HAD-IIB family hydrolase [Modicisalibacter sp. R2A 31.J]MBZ9573835.1 HAD-IIB family hydrolase [Modicisalibacter sp. MOD 31.J]
MTRPEPLASAPPQELARVSVVLTDVDDTLTRHGRLASTTLAALERLADAGITVIPVTGGCAGWCDHIVRAWPVAAVIGESGAFRFRRSAGGGLDVHSVRPLKALREEQRRLLTIAERAMQEVPGARLAADQPFRLADVAVDHAQDVAPLDAAAIQQLVDAFKRAGASARASSIHVNAWFGAHDKATMAAWALEHDLGLDATARRERVLFIGDAPNDASLFGRHPLGVGVANLAPHLDRLPRPPRWLCEAGHGQGFEEMAEALLAARE